MIELDHVSKTFRLKGVRKTILNETSFCLPPGRNIALMGRNGSGKSTLLRLIAGIESPDRGRIIRDGSISWPLGFSGAFNGSMTGMENARFAARIYCQDTDRVIEELANFSELGSSLRLPVKSYSSGMRARLAFGLSMAIDFDIYLVDEIIAVGDEGFKQKSKAALKRKLDRSRVIMVSHSARTIRDYCDYGLLLEDGRLTGYDDLRSLVADYKVLARNRQSQT